MKNCIKWYGRIRLKRLGLVSILDWNFSHLSWNLRLVGKKPNYLDMTQMVGIVFEKFKNDQFEPQISLVFIMLLHFVAVKNIL
jgi:hypothetical protein